MAVLLAALGVAFAALCVWLAVRIVNRRDRWAKWTIMAAAGIPLLYVGSFGPACWAVDYGIAPEVPVAILYRPLSICVVRFSPLLVEKAVVWYGAALAPKDKVPSASGRMFVRTVFGIPPTIADPR